MTDSAFGPVRQIAHVVPVSQELADDYRQLTVALTTHFNRTPQERARLDAEAKALRERERAETPLTPVTVQSLLGLLSDVFGVDEAEALHMVQGYCSCDEDSEGGVWHCAHWRDLHNES